MFGAVSVTPNLLSVWDCGSIDQNKHWSPMSWPREMSIDRISFSKIDIWGSHEIMLCLVLWFKQVERRAWWEPSCRLSQCLVFFTPLVKVLGGGRARGVGGEQTTIESLAFNLSMSIALLWVPGKTRGIKTSLYAPEIRLEKWLLSQEHKMLLCGREHTA